MEITEIQVDGYQRVARCRDDASGLHALIAVHDTTLGPALGGMRMLPYVSEDEAMFDVLRLSKGMTYKSAVAETGLGGGKSVIIGDPAKKSPELFRAMGRFVEAFEGQYITAEDMNIGIADLNYVHETTKHVTGLSREEGSSGNPSPYTARGVFQGLRAVAEEAWGSDSFEGRHVVMQGVGAVGLPLALMLKEAGAKLTREHGFTVVPDAGHHAIECDIYAPCARGAGVNDETIPELNCKAVAGAANNILLEERHADVLKELGIVYAPDYVINAGGIINVGVEVRPEGYDETEALRRVDRVYDNLKEVFEVARREGISTLAASGHLAEERIEAAKKAGV
ncbi:MAG: Glu/Leu/Phe/Val dehydrogenase dimerization domain-containing protein [Planctomycetota bacterium]|nr:Glu/Leu/Phe/Val dehydrogenase dimerization domain-containing protein [Planctomycetota bacterium]